MNEWLSNASAILSFIVLLGSAVAAIGALIARFSKPFKERRKRIKEQEEAQRRQEIDEELKRELPEILKQHDLEVRDRYRADRENYLHEIEAQVLTDVRVDLQTINDVKNDVTSLQTKMDGVEKGMSIMADSARDVLREKIMFIYHHGKATKSMPQHHREALDQYYKDYKAMKGNSYIDKYFKRMKDWKVLDDDYDE